MKCLLLLLLLPLFGRTQKIVLIDRHFREPVAVTDSISLKQFSSSFPVYLNQFDSLIRVAEEFRQRQDRGKGERGGRVLFSLESGQFASDQMENAYNKKGVLIVERVADVQTFLGLVAPADLNRKAAQKLPVFIDSFRNDRPLLTPEPARNP